MSSTRVLAQPAFVLHVRPYRETSAIADLLTRDHGRVSVVARGVRGTRRKRPETLAPFVRLELGWSGRGQLRTLGSFEAADHHWLSGDALFAGLYVNEIVLRLLRPDDPHEALFVGYAQTVTELAESRDIEPCLRRFERLLLREAGYELVLDRDADSGAPIDPTRRYRLEPELGLCQADDEGYPGHALLAIAVGDYGSKEARRVAKRIMREALAPHLGERPLKSRTLFRSVR